MACVFYTPFILPVIGLNRPPQARVSPKTGLSVAPIPIRIVNTAFSTGPSRLHDKKKQAGRLHHKLQIFFRQKNGPKLLVIVRRHREVGHVITLVPARVIQLFHAFRIFINVVG